MDLCQCSFTVRRDCREGKGQSCREHAACKKAKGD